MINRTRQVWKMGKAWKVWKVWKAMRAVLLSGLVLALPGCSDPHVYGSIGISSGYGSWGHGGWGSGVSTSISVGGRIR